ncbi:MAG: hypothetical protein JNN27_21705 [Planctomycetes bacterium]|nr:hypothetical protein [Planctomycetota bacterium]
MTHSDASQWRGRSTAAPWFLVLALLLLAAAAVVTLLRSRAVEHNAPPLAGDPARQIAVLRGEAALPDGGRLHAEFAPLRAAPEQQSFEAASLARALGLASGQPWRLHLRREAPAAQAQGGAQSPETQGSARGIPALAFAALSVHDAQGAAAQALEVGEPQARPADPVRTLFAPAAGGVAPGEALDVLLWGRGCEEPAQLRGLLLDGAPLALELEPVQLAQAELERPFTHRTRGEETLRPGKNRAAAASQTPRGARTGAND